MQQLERDTHELLWAVHLGRSVGKKESTKVRINMRKDVRRAFPEPSSYMGVFLDSFTVFHS